jgi:hypothetical protein
LIPWLIAGFFGLSYYFGGQEVRRFENLAAQDIRSKLEGPNVQVDVKTKLNGLAGVMGDLSSVTIKASDFSTEGLPLFTEKERSTRGKVQEMHLILDNFRLSGLRIEHLEARIPDCRYDFSLALRKRQIRLSRSGVGQGRVRILEKDLEAFILQKYREIKRVSVRVDKHKVFVEGYGEFLIIKTNFLVIADLEPLEGTKLVLSNARILFDDRRADEASAAALLETLNPVVDLKEDLNLYDAIYVRGITLVGGVLEAWGDTKIPELPAERVK